MSKVLTSLAIGKLRPEATRKEIPTGQIGGLYVVVHPSGQKSFVFRYRDKLSGKGSKVSLGPFVEKLPLSSSENSPEIGAPQTLATARLIAAQLKIDLASGKSISKARVQGSTTFAEAAVDYSREISGKNKRWRETAALLGVSGDFEVLPEGLASHWRNLTLDKIDADVIYRELSYVLTHGVRGAPVRKAGPLESRQRVLFRALSSLFSWMLDTRRIKINPIIGLKAPGVPKSRERTLSDAELVALWKCLEKVSNPFGDIVRLLILTGQRLGEVSGLRRTEVVSGVWTIPSIRTKNGVTHTLKFGSQAEKIINQWFEKETPFNKVLIFSNTGKSAPSGWSKIKLKIDALMAEELGELPPWRLHDIRRTWVTNAARIGVALPVVERAVNHTSGSFGGIAGVYNKHSFQEEIASAMVAMDRFVLDLVNGGPASNVIQLKK